MSVGQLHMMLHLKHPDRLSSSSIGTILLVPTAPVFINNAALAAALNTSSTPSRFFAEHSVNLYAPILAATSNPYNQTKRVMMSSCALVLLR